MMELDRRRLVISAAGLAIGGAATARLLPDELLLRDRRPARSRVAILSAEHYSEGLTNLVLSALREFRFTLREKTVLLKPNLVEYIAGVDVNTNPLLIGAAAEAFLKLVPVALWSVRVPATSATRISCWRRAGWGRDSVASGSASST